MTALEIRLAGYAPTRPRSALGSLAGCEPETTAANTYICGGSCPGFAVQSLPAPSVFALYSLLSLSMRETLHPLLNPCQVYFLFVENTQFSSISVENSPILLDTTWVKV
jgi:hypothetical protein